MQKARGNMKAKQQSKDQSSMEIEGSVVVLLKIALLAIARASISSTVERVMRENQLHQ